MYIFHFGKKYDNFERKIAYIRGKRWKKGGKEEIFIVLWGKNIILEKGGGQKINYLDDIHPSVFL